MKKIILFITILFVSCQSIDKFDPKLLQSTKNPLQYWSKKGGDIAYFFTEKDSIVGQTTSKITVNADTYLALDGLFGDFELELSFKTSNIPVGIFFRSSFQKVYKLGWEYDKITGYKCHIDPLKNNTGFVSFVSLDGKEKWLSSTNKEKKVYKPLDWNKLKISTFGGKIKIFINSVLVSEFRNSKVATGKIAIQIPVPTLKNQIEQKVFIKGVTIKEVKRK